jgi:hypothetical protein
MKTPAIVAVLLALGAGLNLRLAAASPLDELDRYSFSHYGTGGQLTGAIYERSRRQFAVGDAARDALRTPAQVEARREAARAALLAGIGGLPPMDTPLSARTTGEVRGDGFRIEKVLFQSRPGHYVTALLYLPDQRPAERSGAVLFLCGHHNVGKVVDEYQSVCQTLARAGLIVLAQDPIGQGERFSYDEPGQSGPGAVGVGVLEHDYAGAQCRLLGDGLARYMLHDAMRGIDYLCSRPEVDPARIGVTGNSGGGTQTSLVMLVDRRVAAAAPATFIMSRESYQRTGQAQDAEQIWPGFTAGGFDHEDILLALAPKPVQVMAVTWDFFPIEGTRRTVERARRVWGIWGRGDDLRLTEDDSIHAYTPKLARTAAEFFAQHLLGRARVTWDNFSPRPFPAEQLRVTQSGQVKADFPAARLVHDETADRLRAAEAARAALPRAERRERARAWVQAQLAREGDAVAVNPRRIVQDRTLGNFRVDVAYWFGHRDVNNFGILIRPTTPSAGPRPVTVAVWEDGTAAISRHAEWIAAECGRGRAVLVVSLSGMGTLKPDAINSYPLAAGYGTWHKLSDDLQWLGDSMVAWRSREALRTLEVVRTWPELSTEDIRFYGEGRIGVHARLAALAAPRELLCEWTQPFRFADLVRPVRYDNRDIKTYLLPGVLRVMDLDEL